jgi:hypothetical protein
MKKTGTNDSTESGFILILFMVLLPVILVLLGLVVDSANLYSANLKASAAAEAGVTSAVLSRIKEKDTRILTDFNSNGDINLDNPDPTFEKRYLEQRTIEEARNILLNNSVNKESSGTGNGDRSLEIHTVTANFDPDPQVDLLTVNVQLKVPTLFMHYLQRKFIDKSGSQLVTGTASVKLQGANYIFLLDLSNSQSCPAGIKYPGRYCRCNSSNKVKMTNPDGTDKRDADGKLVYETCQEEANGVSDPSLRGLLRVQKTRDSLKNALYRLDPKRDRLSIIGFNSVAFTLLPFNPVVSATKRAAVGFDMVKTRKILDQLKSPTQARAEFRLNGRSNFVVEGVPFIVPEGMTNLSDGFLTAYQEAHAAGLTNPDFGAPYDIIYYSDGGSTAMRANFPNITKPNRETPDLERTPRRFEKLGELDPRSDRTSYINLTSTSTGGARWANDLLNFHIVLRSGNLRFDAATPMISTGSFKRLYLRNLWNVTKESQLGDSLPLKMKKPRSQYPIFYPPPTPNETAAQKTARYNKLDAEMLDPYSFYDPNLMPDCFCAPSGPRNIRNCNVANTPIDPAITDTDPRLRTALFDRCLGSRDFIGRYSKAGNNPNPDKDRKEKFGEGFKSADIFPPRGRERVKDFRYLYYMSAMEAADLLRSKRGKIHGIGYGESTGNIQGMAQGLGDVAGMKQGVMANLSSDFVKLKRIYGVDDLSEIDRQFNPSNTNKGYQTLKEREDSGSSGGSFTAAPNANEFEKYLDRLLSNIKMSVQGIN